MYTSTLIEIFKNFTPKEIKDFEDFAASPYYNKNKNVAALFKLVKSEYPDFSKGNLTKEKIYKKIYHSYFLTFNSSNFKKSLINI